MVLETFRGPCPPGLEGCHGDGDGFHNELANLRWDTHQSNMQDAIDHGTFVPPPRARGAKLRTRRAIRAAVHLSGDVGLEVIA